MTISVGAVGLCGVHLGRMLLANPDSRVHIEHRLQGVPDEKAIAEGEVYSSHAIRRFLANYFQDKPMTMAPGLHTVRGSR